MADNAHFVDTDRNRAMRRILRDIDWAREHNSDRWLDSDSRWQRFQELADAKVVQRKIRKSTPQADRASATTAWHDADSLRSLWSHIVHEVERNAVHHDEWTEALEAPTRGLAELGGRIAPATCKTLFGYRREEEMENLRQHFGESNSTETEVGLSTFHIPLVILDRHTAAGDGDGEGLREKMEKEARNTRLSIGDHLDRIKPDSPNMTLLEIAEQIATTVPLYIIDQSGERKPRDACLTSDFLRRMVITWNEKTQQWPPATTDDLIWAGSEGDIVRVLDDRPDLDPRKLVMGASLPTAGASSSSGHRGDNITMPDYTTKRPISDRLRSTLADQSVSTGLCRNCQEVSSTPDNRKRHRACSEASPSTQLRDEQRSSMQTPSFQHSATPESLSINDDGGFRRPAKRTNAAVNTSSSQTSSFTLVDRDLAGRLERLYCNITSAVHGELYKRGISTSDPASLTTSPSLQLSKAYEQIFGFQQTTASARPQIRDSITNSQVMVAIVASFLSKKILADNEDMADFSFAQYEKSVAISGTVKEDWFDEELRKTYKTDYAALVRGTYLRYLADEATMSQISAVVKAMVRHGLGNLIEEHLSSAAGSSNDFEGNVRRWAEVLTEAVRDAAVLALETSCACEQYTFTWIGGGESYDRKCMKGVTGHGEKVLTSMFPGLLVKYGGKTEVECLALVKTVL